MKLTEETIEKKAESFGKDFLKEINRYPLGSISKSDYDCLIVGLLENHQLISGSSRDMAVGLQTTPTILKNLRVRYHARFEDDNCIDNVKEMFKEIFNIKSQNDESKAVKLKIYYDNDSKKIIFSVDNPIQRDDFRAYIESKGYFTDTSFNNNIISINHAVFLDFLQENGSEVLGCDIINEKFVEIIKTKINGNTEFDQLNITFDDLNNNNILWRNKFSKFSKKALSIFWNFSLHIIQGIITEYAKTSLGIT